MGRKRKTAGNNVSDPETWVDQYGDYLYRYALSRIQDPVIAEDFVQETFLAALDTREAFQGRSSERTWLTAILKHKIIDHLRKAGRKQSLENTGLHNDPVNEFFDERGHWRMKLPRWSSNPAKLFERKEFWKVLSDCLSELPARLAHAFRLREMDGLSSGEICEILEISTSNCSVMLHRARLRLRGCIEKNWFSVHPLEGT